MEPFSSPAVPASSAATPAKRSPRTASSRFAFDDLSRGHADFVRWVRSLTPIFYAAFERHRPGAVIHFSALAYIGEPMSRPPPYYRVNVAGLINVLEAMLRHGTRTMFSSSRATYGIPNRLPIAEDAPQRPINPYGRSKLAGEQILTDARSVEKLRVAMLLQPR
jgi:UDP-arabinose 4-epimerase